MTYFSNSFSFKFTACCNKLLSYWQHPQAAVFGYSFDLQELCTGSMVQRGDWLKVENSVHAYKVICVVQYDTARTK